MILDIIIKLNYLLTFYDVIKKIDIKLAYFEFHLLMPVYIFSISHPHFQFSLKSKPPSYFTSLTLFKLKNIKIFSIKFPILVFLNFSFLIYQIITTMISISFISLIITTTKRFQAKKRTRSNPAFSRA